jgi:hypothetical protein
MRVAAQQQQKQSADWQAGSSEDDACDEEELDQLDAADAAASKFMKSSQASKAGRRKARKAAAATAASPAGDRIPSSSQEAKHERKQKQKQQQQQHKHTAAANTGAGASSVGGIAEGHVTDAEKEMVKHALTQMSYLKQEAPFTFTIQKGTVCHQGCAMKAMTTS